MRFNHPSAQFDLAVVIALCVWVLMLRLPFFFPATLDWDESTYIIMGQSVLDGHLPYDKVWQNKPPLAYAFFASAILLFGKTIVSVRFFGYLCVVLTSYLVYRGSYSITQNRLSACVAALASATMTSLLQPETMTEIICIVPLSAALILLFGTDIKITRTFLVGLLIGTAVMIRTNLGFLAIAAGAYISLRPSLFPLSQALSRGFAYAAGVVLVIVATMIPFFGAGQLQLWFDAVVFEPLQNSSDLHSFNNLSDLVANGFGIDDGQIKYSILVLGVLVWIGGLVGMVCCVARWDRFSELTRNRIIATGVFLFGAIAAVVMTGPSYSHYLVQLIPWFAIFLSLALEFPSMKALRWAPLVGTCIALMVIAVGDTRQSYDLLLERIKQGKSLAYGAAFDIADYLQATGSIGRPLYLADAHIVYWLVGAYPPTRILHPSDINRTRLLTAVEGPGATPEMEMQKIIQTRPDFIIKPPAVGYLASQPGVTRLLDEALARDYTLEVVIAGRQIYRRKSDVSIIKDRM